MNFIYKNMLAIALLFSVPTVFAVVPVGQSAIKEAVNALLQVPAQVLASDSGQAITAGIRGAINYGFSTHLHYLLLRSTETSADKLACVAAWYLLGCEIQYVREKYQDLMHSNDKRGWFEYVFSWRTPPTSTPQKAKK